MFTVYQYDIASNIDISQLNFLKTQKTNIFL